jgi:cytochrome d ubiquinol oxidase subunit II
VLFGFAGLFPAMVPSRLDPAASVTAFNAASSPLTLKIMLGVVACVLPVVVGYQFWVYKKFRGVLTENTLGEGMFY